MLSPSNVISGRVVNELYSELLSCDVIDMLPPAPSCLLTLIVFSACIPTVYISRRADVVRGDDERRKMN